ncbi:short-subunit dehydrogenase [Leucobacter exalbidus]|uniref:Short-subunit dehydrogenase n=1 Tax=Leucobacter exalbidus TaxID=662960 RepID=A0A940PXI7_9MICO|nr:SDR family oxidoreductase [Leucobacter exalbidus]MBP1326931.1 short-subunit dehydrogenase [Leucobacter exalbidus]
MTPVILLTGGMSAAGVAVAEELLGRGIAVVIVSQSAASAAPVSVNALTATHFSADLTDGKEVTQLSADIARLGLEVIGLVHLVGGWAGGKGITGQSDEKYDLLAASFHSLRNVSREFHDGLLKTASPRVITVSSPIARRPTPSSANYAAVKAASEAWTLALDPALRTADDPGGASIIITDSLSGREASFARLVADTLAAPVSRVAGKHILHV